MAAGAAVLLGMVVMAEMSYREFVRVARRAYGQLPAGVRRRLENVDVVVEEWPDSEEAGLTGGGYDSLFGLYSGWPLTERGGGLPLLPDRIVIYRQPILRACATRAEAEREIRVTLWHEVGHCLGMSEADLERLGYG